MQQEEKRWTIYDLLGQDDTAEKQERSRESSYRRGWHQGWVYAVDVIFGRLHSGVSVDELYQQIARFENSRVMSWRQDLSLLPLATPDFEVIPEPTESGDDDGYDDDAPDDGEQLVG